MAVLAGTEIKRLMRRNRVSIVCLSMVLGITQKRIREVRESGLTDRNSARDWIQGITGYDPGNSWEATL